MARLRHAATWAAWFLVAFLVFGPTIAGRNGSGTYSIPNTFSTGETITASAFNQNFSDIATEITNSVAADGQTIMTGALKAASGTVGAPALAFGIDPDTGIYRIGADNIGVAVGGTKIADVSSTGLDATALSIGGGAVWSTGDVKLTLKATADAGWVMMDDGTIGDAGSGASTRENADTQNLFTLVFDNLTDSTAPLSSCDSGGDARASQGTAATAWGNNCQIALPKALGRALAVAGAGSGLTSRALGAATGAETATIAQANLPNVNFAVTIPAGEGAHSHFTSVDTGTVGSGAATAGGASVPVNRESTTVSLPEMSGTAASGGSGTALDIMQPSAFLNIMIKL